MGKIVDGEDSGVRTLRDIDQSVYASFRRFLFRLVTESMDINMRK